MAFLLIPVLLFSQEPGDSKKEIIKKIKKKSKKDSLVDYDSVLYCYSALCEGEYEVYRFNKEGACDTIEQHGPLDGVGFYKTTYKMTMHKLNDRKWVMDKGRERKIVELFTTDDQFIFIITKKRLGFLR